jgi:V8-like Glu-specific endopeptidase
MERKWLDTERDDRFIENEIFQPDQRVVVSTTTAIPYRWICKIRVRYVDPRNNQGGWSEGTGVLISPCHVLTNAHVILGKGKPAAHTQLDKIEVMPGLNGTATPFGKYETKQFQIHPLFGTERPVGKLNAEAANSIWDFGIIKLKENIGGKPFASIGNANLRYWGKYGNGSLVRLDETCVFGFQATLSGYPSQKSVVYEHADRVYKISGLPKRYEDRLIGYKIDSEGGQSGSPLWMEGAINGCKIPILIGLHVLGDTATNAAIRITYEVLTEIEKMKKKMP